MKTTIINLTEWQRYVTAMNNKLVRNFKPFDIEVKAVKDRVSRNQQAYIFGVIYPRLKQGLIDCGYELDNITEEQFDYFMREMFYFDVVQTSKGERKLPRRLCFSKAHKDEVTKYIDNLLRFASQVGIYIPSQEI
jgi:hypothetical protein